MRKSVLAAAVLILATCAFAAEIDGKWTGEIEMGPGGDKMPVVYNFKAEGSVLTGSTSIMDSPVEIKDGKIEGDKVSFFITFGEGEQGMKVEYKGVLSGDQLKLTFDMMGQPVELVLKKANE